tara:strand:- start:11715 stop:12113 length:399 start_codon:yes stop_codon:yes gene_type:complete
MPRSNKTQPAAAAKGQQYGEKKEQLDSQSEMPLPSIETNVRPQQDLAPRRSAPVSGEGFSRSKLPNQPITTPIGEQVFNIKDVPLPPERVQMLGPALHEFLALANNINADPDIQTFVRRMQNFIPTKYDVPQ